MKLILSVTLLVFSFSSFASKKGDVILEGKKLALEVGQKSIKLGAEEFKITDLSADQVQGSFILKVNNQTKIDKNIFVFTNPAQVEEFRSNPRGLNLKNGKEVKCSASINAFVLVGDNLNAPYPMIGNCLKLK